MEASRRGSLVGNALLQAVNDRRSRRSPRGRRSREVSERSCLGHVTVSYTRVYFARKRLDVMPARRATPSTAPGNNLTWHQGLV